MSGSVKENIHYKLMYIYLDVCKQMTDVELLLLHGKTWNHLIVCE